MIGGVLSFLRKRLDDYLRAELAGGAEPIADKVVFIEGDKLDPLTFTDGAVSELLVNVEEDRVLRSADPYLRVKEDGKPQRVQPDIKLILSLLFVAAIPLFIAAFPLVVLEGPEQHPGVLAHALRRRVIASAHTDPLEATGFVEPDGRRIRRPNLEQHPARAARARVVAQPFEHRAPDAAPLHLGGHAEVQQVHFVGNPHRDRITGEFAGLHADEVKLRSAESAGRRSPGADASRNGPCNLR